MNREEADALILEAGVKPWQLTTLKVTQRLIVLVYKVCHINPELVAGWLMGTSVSFFLKAGTSRQKAHETADFLVDHGYASDYESRLGRED